MEKIIKKVHEVKEFGDPDQYGNKNYWVTFTDGKSGLFRTPNNDLFIDGQEAEYSVKEVKQGKKGPYDVLQRYKEDYVPGEKKSYHSGHGKSQNSEEVNAMINRSVAIKAVCEFRAGSRDFTIEEVIAEADQFLDYIQFGIKDEKETPHQEAVKAGKAAPKTDELPF